MRNTMLAAVLLLLPGHAVADPRATVLTQECREAGVRAPGFECTLPKGSLVIHWTENLDAMPEARRKQVWYEYNKIIFRYAELGGTTYTVTSVAWGPERIRGCSIRHNRKSYCGDYLCKPGKECVAMTR